MIIAISGTPGSGNTSLARDLAAKTGYPVVGVGEIVKAIAKKDGLFLGKEGDAAALLAKKRKNPVEWASFNRKIDAMQRAIARKSANCIVNGKLSAFNIPDADLKVLLIAGDGIRAKRVAKRDGITYAKALRDVRAREKTDRTELKRLYGFDYAKDVDAYDIVIRTDAQKRSDTRDIVLICLKALRRRK